MDLYVKAEQLKGSINIPSSKSMGHRAIICASLASGKSYIDKISYSDDIEATIASMRKLGAKIIKKDFRLEIEGIGHLVDVEKPVYINEYCGKISIDCKESGSTLRFIIPLLSLFKNDFIINTNGRLLNRPLGPYFDIYKKLGIDYYVDNKTLYIENNKIFASGEYTFDGAISSQFISAMLFFLPLLRDDSLVKIKGDLESKAYVEMTISCLKEFGIEIENDNYREFIIKGGQKYKPTNMEIEGDFSQAAFFEVGSYLQLLGFKNAEKKIDVKGLNEYSAQADKAIVSLMHGLYEINYLIMNECTSLGESKKVDKIIKKINSPHFYVSVIDSMLLIDGRNIPDIVPIISLYLSLCKFKSKIYNIARLKIKESDRLYACYSELSKLGAKVELGEDYLKFEGVNSLVGGVEIDTYGDHRIAMMAAIASLACEKYIKVKNADCVSKSYPNFWDDFVALGGEISDSNLGQEF